MDIIVITSIAHSRHIVNFNSGNERTLGGITHAVGCHKVKIDRVTACYCITACCFNRNRAILSEAVRCVSVKFSTVRGFLDVACCRRVISKVDVTRRVNIYVRSNYIIGVAEVVGCGNTEGCNVTACKRARFKCYSNVQGCAKAVLCRRTEEACVNSIGCVDLGLFAVEFDFGSTVNLDSAYRSRLYVAEVVGCRNEELKRRACLLNTFGKFKRNIVKNVSEAILCYDTESRKSNIIGYLEGCRGCRSNGRRSINLDAVGNIICIALAIGCAALDGDGITACKGAAISRSRYGKRNAKAVNCGCTEVIT